MRKAYSYTRFSSRLQSKGGSRERQQESFEVTEFIKFHKLSVIQYITDEGVSGFTGKNFSNTAALGKFIEEIRKGKIERDSVLIVENLDRFSRDNITECITRFIEIIKSGVSIGIVAMNIIIDLEQINTNAMLWNYVSNEFQRARSESKRKSVFQLNNISRKVNRAKNGEKVYFGAQCPSWLKGIKDNKWIIDKEVVATIEKVFKMYLSGLSCVGVAKRLNEQGVTSMYGNNWYNTSIRHILGNRNLIGWCKINDFESEDYYPQIIDDTTFQLAQSRLSHNKSNRGGSNVGNVPNMFKGLLFCSKCGGGIDVQSYKYKDHYNRYCQCRNAPLRICKDKTKWRMDKLEEQIFFMILEKSPAELLEKPKTKTDTILSKLNRELGKTNIVIHRTTDLMNDPELSDITELKTNLVKLNQKRIQLKNNIQTEEAKQVVINSNPQSVVKLKELLKYDLEKELVETEKILQQLRNNKVRGELKAIMPDLISRIEMNMNGLSFVVLMTNGVRQEMSYYV